MLNKILALCVGALLVFAVNRSKTGQAAMVATGQAVSNAGESMGIKTVKTQAEKNLLAFLMMIRLAEGTAGIDGYRMLFGGGLFLSLADHPRKVITRKSGDKTISSSAAGAYQILQKTWDVLKARLSLPDFSEASQDKAAIELIREKNALQDVYEGRFSAAVVKIKSVWASMPGAGYGQPEKKLAALESAYKNAGGVIA